MRCNTLSVLIRIALACSVARGAQDSVRRPASSAPLCRRVASRHDIREVWQGRQQGRQPRAIVVPRACHSWRV